MKKILICLLLLFTVKVNASSDCEYFILPVYGVNEYQSCIQDPAAYSSYFIYHDVVFYDGANIVSSVSVKNNSSAIAPTDPVKQSFTFTGWDVSFSNVTTDINVNALFSQYNYTLTYKDYNGSTLKSESVLQGSDGNPPSPTRVGYDFNGWSNSFENVTGDTTLFAQYSIKTFTVRFFDLDNNILKQQVVNYNYSATPPAAPVESGRTFMSWSGNYTNVKSSNDVYAVYDVDSFNVTFMNDDVLKVESVPLGGDATAPSANRTGYSLVGWDKSFSNVSSDLVVTAIYEIDYYNVTFLNHLGAVMQSDYIEFNGDAVPPSLVRQGYDFLGWDGNYRNISRDITLIPIFEGQIFNIVFLDHDGTEYLSEQVGYGEPCSEVTPVREGYTYVGGSEDCASVTSNQVISLLYEPQLINVKFMNNDQIIYEETINYNECATEPEVAIDGFTIIGWDNDICNILEDTIFLPVVEAETFNVVFKDYNGTTLKTETISYGGTASCQQPTRSGYNFSGWSGSLVIKNNTTLFASYSKKSFSVKFYLDSELISSKVVSYGSSASAPVVELEGRIFVGWDKSFDSVYNNLKVNAITEAIAFEVVYMDHDMVKLSTDSVSYGTDSVPPIPERVGYVFTGWSNTEKNIMSDSTLIAQYVPRVYQVQFIVDGTVIETIETNYGSTITPNQDYIWEQTEYLVSSNLVIQGDLKACVAKIHDIDGIVIEENDCVDVEHVEIAGYKFVDWEIVTDKHLKLYYPNYMELEYKVRFHFNDSIIEELALYGRGVEAPRMVNGTKVDKWDVATDFITSDMDVFGSVEPDYYPILRVSKDDSNYSLKFGESIELFEIGYFIVDGVIRSADSVSFEMDKRSLIDRKVNWINITLDDGETLDEICLVNDLDYIYVIEDHLIEKTFWTKIISWFKSIF